MVNILRELLTGKDGVSHDLGRYSWMASFAGLVVITGWNLVHGAAVSMREFAEASGIIAAAHGAALWAKAATEPKPPEEPKQ